MKLLGDLLVGGKALSAELRDKALAHQKTQKGARLGTGLLEMGFLTEELLLRALSVQRQVPPAPSGDLQEIRPDILRLVPVKLASRLQAIPFKRVGRDLFLAMRDPSDLPAVDEISFLTGLAIKPHIALEFRVNLAIAKHYKVDSLERFQKLAEKLSPSAHDAALPSPAGRPAAPSAPSAPSASPVPAPRPASRTASGSFPVLASSGPAPAPPPPPEIDNRRLEKSHSGVFPLAGGDPWGTDSGAPFFEQPALLTDTFEVTALPAGVAPQPTAIPPLAELPPAEHSHEISKEIEDEDFRRFREAGTAEIESTHPEAVSSVASGPDEPPVAELPPETPEVFNLIQRLSAAESRDDVAEAILTAASNLKRAALFIAQADRVIGWAAHPAPPDGLRSFSLPYSEPSVFATLRNTEGFYVGPCPDLPGNRKILHALGQEDRVMIAVVPITLKGKSVLFFFGETDDEGPPPAIPELKRLATMTATALEILLLKNRLRQL